MTKTAADVEVDFNRLGPASGARMVVAGGCGGMGRTLVRAAIKSGVDVTVLDLPVSAERHPVPAGVSFRAIDAVDERSVQQAFSDIASVGLIDALVNLVGFRNDLIPVEELTSKSWDEVVDGNLRSAFLICRAALPVMADAGTLVNVASGLGARVLPGYSPYSASKAGLIALTKGIAAENAPRLRANAIAPAAVKTAFLSGGTGRVEVEEGDWDSQYGEYAKAIPLGRLGEVEDIIGPILFLSGPASRYMTGQVLWINGGGLTP